MVCHASLKYSFLNYDLLSVETDLRYSQYTNADLSHSTEDKRDTCLYYVPYFLRLVQS